MNAGAQQPQPPRPVGEPWRGDPRAPAPFPVEGEPPAPTWRPAPLPPPATQQPATPEQPAGPQLRPAPRRVLDADQRFARAALWTGVVSVFIFNIVIGPIAIVMGLLAIRRGQPHDGRLAILFGSIGTLIGVVLLVLVARGVLPELDQLLSDLKKRQ